MCGGINDHSSLIEGTIYVKCYRCNLTYASFELSNQYVYRQFLESDLTYAELIDRYATQRNERTQEAINIVANLPRCDGALIVGSGAGFIYHEMRAVYGSWRQRLYGFDASARKLDLSRDLFDYKQRTYYSLAEEIEFVNKFDIVLVNNVLSWVESPIHLMSRMNRAARNGLFLFVRRINPLEAKKAYRILWDKESLIDLLDFTLGPIATLEEDEKYYIIRYIK
jgi:SAM-dependent methyltransferase